MKRWKKGLIDSLFIQKIIILLSALILNALIKNNIYIIMMENSRIRISQLVFNSLNDSTDSFLVAAVKLLFSCDLFVKKIFNTPLKCRTDDKHYCLACGLVKGIIQGCQERIVNLNQLRMHLAEVYEEKVQFVLNNNDSDSIEAVFSLLNSLHTDFLADNSEGRNEEVVLTNCREECSSHSNFYLGIEEIYRCKCGHNGSNIWDYSNYCQYFNAAGLLEGIDQNFAKALLIIPDFKLKTLKINSNALIMQGKIIEKLQAKLLDAQVEYCFNQNCEIKESAITFNIINYPETFLINIIWDNKESSHLESLISTISIAPSLYLNQIYGNGRAVQYQLKGILFYRRDRFDYACRYDKI